MVIHYVYNLYLPFIFVLLRINYALYEELDAGDMERTRDVYRYAAFCEIKVWKFIIIAGLLQT